MVLEESKDWECDKSYTEKNTQSTSNVSSEEENRETNENDLTYGEVHSENDPQHEKNNVESASEDNATEEEDIPQRQEER